MSDIAQVKDIVPRIQYTASAGQTVFVYPFPIFDDKDIAVVQNKSILTLGTDYSVSGATNEDGGNVVLTVGATSGDIITLYRDMALERLVDYQQNGDFLAANVNRDFDRLWLAIQQVTGDSDAGESIGRAWRASQIDSLTSSELIIADKETRSEKFVTFDENGKFSYLPIFNAFRADLDDPVLNSSNTVIAPVATRADKLVGFDSSGLFIYRGFSISSDPSQIYDNTLQMDNDPSLISGLLVRTEGYNSAGDRGWNHYEIGTGFGTADNGSVFDLSASGLQAKGIFPDGVITPQQFGAVGVGDDTAKFAALEAFSSGGSVDLGEGIFTVTAVPDGNNYYNGAFRVGTEIFRQNRNAREHPFSEPTTGVRYIDPEPRVYRGLNVLGPIDTGVDGVSVYVWRQAKGHGTQNDTSIMCARSDDFGNTWLEEPYEIFRVSTADTRNFAGGMMNGRIAIVAARIQEDGVYQAPIFIFSDDNGVTWSSNSVTVTSGKLNFHSRIYPYPTSAGGDDLNGFICYAYDTNTGSVGHISVLSTTDNGANWTETQDVLVPDATFTSLSEMSVARVGAEDKWVMVLRNLAGANAAVSTSTNLTTWTTLKDSGLKLGANPPELFYDDGKLWFLSFSRRDKPILSEHENAIVIAGGNAEEVHSSGGNLGWSGWGLVANVPFWPTGYISVQKIRGRWYGFYNTEDFAGSTQSRTGYLMMLSTDPVAGASYPSVLAHQPNPNLLPNGSLRNWTLGSSFSLGARDTVSDGFTFARASGAPGATISRIAGDLARFGMRVRRDDADTATNDMILCAVLPLDDSIPLRAQQVTLSFRARAASGFSASNSFLTVQLRQTNNATEQVVSSNTGVFAIGDTPVGTSSSGVTLGGTWQKFSLNPSKLLDDATQLMIRITWTPVGTAASDYFDIELLKLEIGANATPFEYEPFHIEQARSNRFTQKFDVQSVNGVRYIQFSPRMHRIPSVTVSAGTAGNITTSGFELTHTAVTTVTVTAKATL